MKQYMKRVLLVLSMVVSLFALSACSNKNAAEAETMDPQTASYISQISENLLQTIAEMDEATAEESETGLLKQGEDGLASGLTSWIGVMKDTGAFVSVLSSDTELGEDDQYVCVIQAQFEKRNVEFKAFYTMDPQSQNLNPVSLTFSPEYTVGENMAKAGMNTLTWYGYRIPGTDLHQHPDQLLQVHQRLRKQDESKERRLQHRQQLQWQHRQQKRKSLWMIWNWWLSLLRLSQHQRNSSTDSLVVRSIKRAPGAKWKRA